MINKFLIILLILAQPMCARCAEQKFSPELLKQDFKQLYEGLQSAQYNLYVNTSKTRFDRIYQEKTQKLSQAMSKDEATVMFQKFAAQAHIAHTRVDLPSETFSAFLESGGHSFPMYIKIKNKKVYITENYTAIEGIAIGDQLLSINGEKINSVLDDLRLYLSADSRVMSDGFLEFQLPYLLWLEYGALDEYEVSVKSKQGIRNFKVSAQTRENISNMSKKQPARLDLGWQREAKMLPGQLAYLRPGPFFNFEGEADEIWDRASFIEFIDSAFTEFAAQGAQALLIDLRDNPGGDNSFSDVMISWFADQPFRFASRFSIKVSPETTQSNQVRLDQNKNAVDTSDISSQFAKAFAQRKPGDIFDFDIPMAEPRASGRFEKPVFALVNRHSYSNTVFVAAMLQDYGWATILGEETRDLATSYGAMEHFTLPHTGIRVGYPKAFIIRPSGDQTIRGVVPDVLIDTPIIEYEEDVVLKQAIDVLNKKLKLTKSDQSSIRKQVVKAMIAAVNQQDAKAYVSHFTEDVIVLVEGEIKVNGHQQLLDNRLQHFKKHPQVKAQIQHLAEIDDRVIMHDQVWLHGNKSSPADIVEIMTFTADNKIREMHVIQPQNLFEQ
ncbi:S41 family peptidase [Marinicella sp. W31]|uniref:S41 family peptidase n=1 Tax=Marinicella sp. W31 TaxID=3023713 RepID=UPI003756EC34